MIDIIAYIPDLKKFREKAAILARNRKRGFVFESGTLLYDVRKTPVIYRENESISLLRLDDDELALFNEIEEIQRIGEVVDGVYKFDYGKKSIYNRIWPRPILTDSEGNKYQDPEMFGLFS